ncbi:uncharacterized protein LAESUDRAFT_664142 [Laetiporus sulphureus 93-53]|uniref:Uncharacterized protein n=1 Tax=Laetiporus sulphureus 93-53 TaxID=1314785 RepID=A0A165BN21_9APHY|nr:uncharacterized protein LAESUDRAFT_664142 [Laetiporus sulphureus 93-53]KZT01339.1 hypothetical protein LAESUDRAFT_664142 [Laetiporus sulphureus 93-53]
MLQEPLVSVNLATVSMEAFFYGIFFVLSVSSIYLLVHRQRQLQGRNATSGLIFRALCRTPMFIGAVILSVTITAHWALTVTRSFKAFIYYEGGTEPLDFYGNLKQLTEVIKTGFLMATLVVGDSMVIYRTWIIWNRRLIVTIFPLCTLAGLTACGVGITYQFTQYYPGENVFVSAAGRWITSDCVFTLCTNVYCTFMIAFRVWRSHISVKSYSGSNLMGVLATFIESAALYTSWTLFFFISYQSGSNLQFTAVDTWPSMSGIAFMLINVRVGLGWAQTSEKTTTRHTVSAVSGHRSGETSSFAMRPLAVNITTVIDQEEDYELPAKKVDPNGDRVC